MENLIYYPTFEPPSDVWLKFSLLYFENFKSIVPYNRRHLISENFRRIESETDLVTLYAPENEDGYRATLHTIDEVDRIVNDTYNRSGLFSKVNILRRWKEPDNWNSLVYREKFSDNLVYYCEREGIGRRTEEGIIIPEELAFMFMTYLAKEISFRESAAIITDNNRFDNFTNYSRAATPIVDKRTKFAKGLFSILVPKNLSEISFEKLIDFRNRNRGFISAFNQELENVQISIGEGYTHQDFIKRYNDVYSDFSREVLLQGLGIVSIPLVAYILINNSLATTPEYVKEILGGMGIVLGGGYSMNKALLDTRTRRYCKKYMTNLERLR